ncbi:MAG: ABC transporter substrate-binding protein [Chloroflexota bacterium]|nr:ABC transporter substrate-binding protein [Chloroflexota bacterium]
MTRLSLVVVVLLALGFASITAAQEPVQIDIWLLTDRAELWDQLIADFNAENPDIVATGSYRSTDAHKESMRQVINTDAAPDVMFTWGGAGLFGFYVETGGVESLDSTYESLNWADRFSQATIDNATWNGTRYGMPFRSRTMGLYYRRDLFEQAGITAIPTTYEELIAVNDQLVAAGIIPLALGGKFSWMPMRLLDSLVELTCGAELHDDLKYFRASWTDNECTTEAFVEFKVWVDNYMPPDFLGIDPEPGARIPVYTGQAAMMYEGDWMINTFPADGQDMANYGFFHFPADTTRVSFFGEMLLISSTSSDAEKAAAIRFLDWMSSQPTQEANLGEFGGLVPVTNVAVSPDADPLVLSINQQLNVAGGIYLPADQAFPLQVVTEGYWAAQDGVIAGTIDPVDAAAVVQASIDRYIEANPS